MEPWRAELYHHGILGQKWGKRNGPPYPLDAGDHSASEKKAGWRKSLDKTENKQYTTKQKTGIPKAVKVGAVAALTALAVYGAYKTGALDSFKSVGATAAKQAIETIGNTPLRAAGNIPTPPPQQPSPKPKRQPIIRDPKTGFKMIQESVEDSLKNANPLRGTSEGVNNCTFCAIAGALRRRGLDVTARGTGGSMQNMAGVLEDCFKNVKVYERPAGSFAKSPEEAANVIKKHIRKNFGDLADNCSGAVGVEFIGRQGRGHTFSFEIKNGILRFLDYQQGTFGKSLDVYWDAIDPNGNLTFAQLDMGKDGKPLEVNLNTIGKYVNGY